MDGDSLTPDTPNGDTDKKKKDHTCQTCHTGNLTPGQVRKNELWQEALYECGRQEVNPVTIIPDDPSGEFPRILVMPPGITISELIKQCEEHFPVQCYWLDPDNDIVSDRGSENAPYAIRLRDQIEPDEELKEVSARELIGRGIMGISLAEAIELERQHFVKTGSHLGGGNLTMCPGSRDRTRLKKRIESLEIPLAWALDLVPFVGWRHGALCID